MTVESARLEALMCSASEAANLVLKQVGVGGFVHVVSHLDADGLAAAGVIAKALARLDATFRVRIERWIDEKVTANIMTDKPSLIIFADFGSGDLDVLNTQLSSQPTIILDHHQPIGEANSTFIHVNPHLHGIDGSRDLSGAGTAYLMAKAINKANVDLAHVAVIGALGDRQDKHEQKKLGNANETIVEDAVNAGYLKIEKDLLLFGRETRPIHKALACTTNPFISGISGEEDKSLAFLISLGIAPKHGDKWRALRDLSQDEKKKLFSALADYLTSKGFPSGVAENLIGSVYTLTQEEPWTALRDAREYSVLLNATGRMDRPSLGLSVCMGDRGAALEQANDVLQEYRRTITKYLSWLMEEPGRIEELDGIYVVRGDSFVNDKIIGTLSSILSTNLPKPEKPIIAYSTIRENELAKVSARAIEQLTSKGLNLGEILRVAAEKFSGRGGGHNIAAGAQLPAQNMDSFIKLVDELVKKQTEEMARGG